MSSIQDGGQVQINTDAAYGADEGARKNSNPVVGRRFLCCNLIAMVILIVIIALKADINEIFESKVKESK